MPDLEKLKRLIAQRGDAPFTSRDFRHLKRVPQLLCKLEKEGHIRSRPADGKVPGCKKVYSAAKPYDSVAVWRTVWPNLFTPPACKGGKIHRAPT